MPLHIPHDSNLLYLPLMYFLPEDTIVKCPTLCALPRKVREVLYSEERTAIVNSDAFYSEIMDASAHEVFPHFGFRGWKEHYTGYCPVWMLSYMLNAWVNLLEAEIGWNLNALIQIPSSQSIPFFAPEYIKAVMGRVVQRAIEEQGWQPILDAVREMPCDEDFEKWNTNVRNDFLRKWYHTRSKVKMTSLEACIEDADHWINKIADSSSDFISHVVGEDTYQRFKDQLSPQDMEILQLRMQGFTYEAIAERMGYSNHSGVLKRMRAITKTFIKYEEQYQ